VRHNASEDDKILASKTVFADAVMTYFAVRVTCKSCTVRVVRRDNFNSRSVHVEQLVSEVFVVLCVCSNVLLGNGRCSGVWSSCVLHSSCADHMTAHLISTPTDWLFISLVVYSITFLFIVSFVGLSCYILTLAGASY